MLLKVDNVYKRFGGVEALKSVSLTIKKGELVGIIGPNGAGKTTLLNVISGYILPDSGKIYYKEIDITHTKPFERARQGIVRSFQFPLLFNNLLVEDNIKIAISGIMPYSLRDIDYDLIEYLIDLFGLSEIRKKKVSSLSEGHRKLLDVALTMVFKPELLLLDEPTSSVSSQEKFKIMDKIVEILREKKITSIVVEHDLDIVRTYLDRVLIMNEGRVINEIKASEL